MTKKVICGCNHTNKEHCKGCAQQNLEHHDKDGLCKEVADKL